jgi:transcriptional regulator with XRE-family HTH domain
MRTNELIRASRERLKLSKAEVAERSGFSAHEYSDIEQHPDEIMTNVSLGKVKIVCAVLELEVSSLLAAADLGASTVPVDVSQDESLPKELLIKRYREKRNASTSDVADAIGFEEEAVCRAESDNDFLETLPISVLSDWSKYIGLPLVRMLR